MDNKDKTLLALLRNALWGCPVESEGVMDWNAVLLLARQQTVLGLIAEAVRNLPDDLRPCGDHMKKLQHHVLVSYHAHALLDSKLAETVTFLGSHGIQPVLFKGQGLALNYPDPVSRQCGDIDLYVGQDNYEKACRLVIENFGSGERNLESIKHMHIDTGGVTIELHRIAERQPGLFENRRFQKWTRLHLDCSQRRKVEIGGAQVDLAPYNFDAIYVMNHAWHHFINGGIGLRQLCDWTLYLHRFHKDIDIKTLESDLKELGLMKVWRLFSNIAVDYLGLPASECPLYNGRYAAKSRKMMDIILDEGNFGRYSDAKKKKRPEGYTEGKLHSFKMTSRRYVRNFSIYPFYMIKSWILFISNGVYHFLKGLK